ncbi:hypothetical protein [Rossellomorea sp. NRS-1567]
MTKQIPKHDKEKDLSLEEQLKLLSKSIGTMDLGGDSDQICRE